MKHGGVMIQACFCCTGARRHAVIGAVLNYYEEVVTWVSCHN